MGWGTSYINPEGYLNRITIEQIEDEIETEERRVKDAFDRMAIIMASSPADVKYEEGEKPQPWPEYVKEQRDLIEDTLRESISNLQRLSMPRRVRRRRGKSRSSIVRTATVASRATGATKASATSAERHSPVHASCH